MIVDVVLPTVLSPLLRLSKRAVEVTDESH